jgi:hypothetical protein
LRYLVETFGGFDNMFQALDIENTHQHMFMLQTLMNGNNANCQAIQEAITASQTAVSTAITGVQTRLGESQTATNDHTDAEVARVTAGVGLLRGDMTRRFDGIAHSVATGYQRLLFANQLANLYTHQAINAHTDDRMARFEEEMDLNTEWLDPNIAAGNRRLLAANLSALVEAHNRINYHTDRAIGDVVAQVEVSNDNANERFNELRDSITALAGLIRGDREDREVHDQEVEGLIAAQREAAVDDQTDSQNLLVHERSQHQRDMAAAHRSAGRAFSREVVRGAERAVGLVAEQRSNQEDMEGLLSHAQEDAADTEQDLRNQLDHVNRKHEREINAVTRTAGRNLVQEAVRGAERVVDMQVEQEINQQEMESLLSHTQEDAANTAQDLQNQVDHQIAETAQVEREAAAWGTREVVRETQQTIDARAELAASRREIDEMRINEETLYNLVEQQQEVLAAEEPLPDITPTQSPARPRDRDRTSIFESTATDTPVAGSSSATQPLPQPWAALPALTKQEEYKNEAIKARAMASGQENMAANLQRTVVQLSDENQRLRSGEVLEDDKPVSNDSDSNDADEDFVTAEDDEDVDDAAEGGEDSGSHSNVGLGSQVGERMPELSADTQQEEIRSGPQSDRGMPGGFPGSREGSTPAVGEDSTPTSPEAIGSAAVEEDAPTTVEGGASATVPEEPEGEDQGASSDDSLYN